MRIEHRRWKNRAWLAGAGLGLGLAPVASGQLAYPTENPLATTYGYIRSVRLVDIDADGDLDIFSADLGTTASRWQENDGQDPPTFTERTFFTVNGTVDVSFGDIDGDGDTDIVFAMPNVDQVAWYENDGLTPAGFTLHDVATGTHDSPYVVEVVDLDQDGDMDILANYNEDMAAVWYENDGVQPIPGFTERDIDLRSGNLRGLSPRDVDGDSDIDVLFAGFNAFEGGEGPFDDFDGMGWYENLGGSPPTWAKREIIKDLSSQVTHFSVVGADIDNDGDVDAVTAVYFPGRLEYWENSGTNPPTWTERFIGLSYIAFDLDVQDLDADGDLDVVTQSRDNDTVTWFENDGGAGASRAVPAWTTHVIPTTLDRPEAVAAGDLTGDGFMDIVAGWVNSDAVSWHPAVAPPPPVVCVGDLDGDDDTDVLDFATFAGNFGESGLPPNTGGDFDGDGDVDVLDFSAFVADFGCSPGD